MKNRAHQWIDWHSSRYYKEVYWLDWQESECGRAWEQTMFGGHVAPINNRVDGSHGIAISDWPPRGTQNDDERRVWNTIPMHYIEKLFQMSTWKRSFNLMNWRIFHVPRDGATSLYINSFTTMSANEEERVAKEELAEAIALANAQPAKKKRVKASGKTEERRPKDENIIEEAVVEQEQQPESPKQPDLPLDSKRRASSPGALAGQRLILAPHSRRPSSGPLTVPNYPLVPTPRAAPAPPLPEQAKPLKKTVEIYPEHGESLIEEVPKETTCQIIKKMKTKPRGLMAAYRQRHAKKDAEKKKKRNLADRETFKLQESLMQEMELERQLAVVRDELKAMKEKAEVGEGRVVGVKK